MDGRRASGPRGQEPGERGGGGLISCISSSPGGPPAAVPQPELCDPGAPDRETPSPRPGAGSQRRRLQRCPEEAGDDQVPPHTPDDASNQSAKQPGHAG